MDDNQITALAREYAEEIYPNLSDKIISLRTQEIKEAEGVIRFLLRRFYLVEKSKVIEESKSAKHDSKMAHRERLYTMLSVASARKGLLESLFPEITKEVEK